MVRGIQEPPKIIWTVAIAFGCLLELEGQTLFLERVELEFQQFSLRWKRQEKESANDTNFYASAFVGSMDYTPEDCGEEFFFFF